jgi:multiple sugar transport system permease protein
MKRRFGQPGLLRQILTYALLAIGAVVMLIPFYWMIASSMMTAAEIIARPITFLPQNPSLDAYRGLRDAIPIGRMYLNSMIVTFLVTVGILATSSTAGYGFAKFHFPGREVLFLIVLATMMIPFFVVMIPIFWMIGKWGWIDSYQGLIVPHVATAFGIFLMRQYMLSLPDEVLDAARVDGASEFEIFWRIVLPLCTPALGALTILAFVYQWNSFLWPLVVARSDSMWTVPVGLNALRTYASSAQVVNMQMAGATMGVVPLLIVFLALQRYFVRGIALTGVKG